MRLLECNRTDVMLARRIVESGALGGVRERFSEELTRLRASRIPMEGAFQMDERGVKQCKRVRLLLPLDAQASPGDGVWVEDALYRILSVGKWSAHVEWICEAVE